MPEQTSDQMPCARDDMSRNSVPSIEFREIAFRFEGRTILENFNLHVKPGEKIAFTGPSGCGKSSLLRAVMGFILPFQGSVEIAGEPVDSDNIWYWRHRISWVPQDPESGLLSTRSWLEEPLQYRANSHLSSPDYIDKATDLFDRLGLNRDLLDKKASDLSGGERQRTALVSALLLERPVLLLDEPTSSLDKRSVELTYRLLEDLEGRTIIMVSHDVRRVSYFADRVIGFNDDGG